jgi:DNA replication ATP-dependent helicase Dna2
MLAKKGDIEHFENLADSGLIDEGGAYVVGATPFALWSDFTGLKEMEFDTVLLDEASQITVMVAVMAMLRGERWLFFGDDCQLPPVRISKRARALDGSIFQLLRNRGLETMLEESWRLNEALAAWPSATFYGGRLTCRSDRRLSLAPAPRHPALRARHPVGLILEDGGRSRVRSETEAQTVVDLVRELVRGGVRPEDIGVITPFRAQAAAIRKVLQIATATPSLHRQVAVDTVERFQGQEREVILVSLASSRPEWIRRLSDFLFQPERWNVAVTRARLKLIVIASHSLVETAESLADAGDRGAACFSSWYREALRHGGGPAPRKGGG